MGEPLVPLEPETAPGSATPPEQPRYTGKHERLVQVACGIGVLLQSVRYYVTLPLVGYLLTRPLLYSVIHPSTLALVIGGAYAREGLDPLWAVIVLGTVGLALVDPLRWWAGRLYGDRIARLFLANNQKTVDRIERFTARWGTWGLVLCWFTPIPVLFVQLAAGTSGMSFRRFLLADVAGTLLWVLTVVGLGYGIGRPAVTTVKRIGHYSLYVTIAAVVVAVVIGAVRGARMANGVGQTGE